MGLQVAAAGKIINEFTGLAFAGGEFETDNPAIRFVSAEAWTKDAQGAHITFSTAPVGTSSPVEGMRLTSEGILLVGMDTASGSAKLQVSGEISVSGITYAGTLALSATGANPITLATNGTTRLTVAPNGVATFTGNVAVPYLGLTDASAANDTTHDAMLINYGADGTLGPLYLALRARPSATGGSRYATIQVGDNSAYRLLALQPSGGNVTVGMTTDGNYKLDVASSGPSGTLRVYDQVAVTGSTGVLFKGGAGQSTNAILDVQANAGTSVFKVLETKLGFFGATPVVKQTVTADAASILAALQAYGLAV